MLDDVPQTSKSGELQDSFLELLEDVTVVPLPTLDIGDDVYADVASVSKK